MSKQYQPSHKIILLILTLVFLISATLFIHEHHNYGADFAQYIIQALNMINNIPHNTQVTINETFYNFSSMVDHIPDKYPPLTSFILAIEYKFLGLNIKLLKLYNIISLLVVAYTCYYFFILKKLNSFALAAFILVLFSIPLFRFQNFILSDLLFMGFFTLCIYFYEKYDSHNKKALTLTLSLVMIACSILTRNTGLVLLLAVLFQSLIRKKYKDFTIIFLLSLMAIIFFYPLIAPGITSEFDNYVFSENLDKSTAIVSTDSMAIEKVFFMLRLLPEIFFYNPIYLFDQKNFLASLINFLITISIIGSYSLIKIKEIKEFGIKKLNFIDTAFIIYFCLIAIDVFIWGSTPRRYYFPLALPILYFGFYALQYYLSKNSYQNITKNIQRGVAAILLLFILSNILFNYYYKHPERESGAFTKPTIEIYDYITKNTKHEDIIIFRKPRLMSLMTGRRSIANLQFLEPQLEKLTGNIWIVDNVAGRLETNYITSGKKQSYLEEIGEKFEDKEEMLENQQFRILKVNFKKFN